MNQKGIAPIIIVVVLAVLGLVSVTVYSFTSKPNTQNMQNSGIEQVDKENTKENNTENTVPQEQQQYTGPVGSFTAKVVGGYYSYALPADIKMSGDLTTVSARSNDDGWFTVTDLPVGHYSITITHPDYKFSDFEVDVSEGENTHNRTLNGFLKNFQPLNISGQAYKDVNGNGSKDGNEDGFDIFFNLYIKNNNAWNQSTTIYTDGNGNFSFEQDLPGTYKLEPVGATFYTKPGPVEFTVDGYGGSKNYMFGYKPQVSEEGMYIYVFNDKNENGSKDSGEEYIHYQTARITNLSGTSSRADGNTWRVAVPPSGSHELALDWGDYKVELEPEDSSWEYYYKITKREQLVFIYPETGTQTVELGAHKLY